MADIPQSDHIRLAIDVTLTEPMMDKITGANPNAWHSTDLQIKFALFSGSELLDVTKYATVQIDIKPGDNKLATPSLLQQVLAQADLNPSLTIEDWNTGADQHGIFSFTFSQIAALDLQGQDARDFWLVISSISNDAEPQRRTLGGTRLRIIEDGVLTAAPPDVDTNPVYPTFAQMLAAIGQVIRPDHNDPGVTCILKSPDGAWGVVLGCTNDGVFTATVIANPP